MTLPEFEKAFRAGLNHNFDSIEFGNSYTREKLEELTRECGNVKRVLSLDVGNPKATYPTLQARAIVVRENCTVEESYRFIVRHERRLVLVGMSSGKVPD